jgi:dihydroneopterin aldolase
MTIHIENFDFEVIIGLLDFERITPQRVVITLEATYTYSEDIFINYADIVMLIQENLQLKKYILLENALLGIKTLLHNKYPKIQHLYIKISKPDIIDSCTVSLSKTWNF